MATMGPVGYSGVPFGAFRRLTVVCSRRKSRRRCPDCSTIPRAGFGEEAPSLRTAEHAYARNHVHRMGDSSPDAACSGSCVGVPRCRHVPRPGWIIRLRPHAVRLRAESSVRVLFGSPSSIGTNVSAAGGVRSFFGRGRRFSCFSPECRQNLRTARRWPPSNSALHRTRTAATVPPELYFFACGSRR